MKRKWSYSLNLAACMAVLFMTAFSISCSKLDTEAERNKELVIQALKLIQEKSYDDLNRYYAEDYVRHCQATPDAVVESFDAIKALWLEWDESFTDFEHDTQATIAEGDLVAFYGSFSATQTGQMGPFPPTGKRMKADFAGYHRIADGKIAETWVTWDNMTTLQQLGLFPPPPEDGD